MMKRTLSVCLAAAIALPLALLGACAPHDVLEEEIIEDGYDNYYEIYVGSFCDSDNDGKGDLRGVTQKLSYVRDLGYTGIWLMPICKSPSYHKYDVEDYKAVDPAYGTMDDFKEMVARAHELGIDVIIDMVFNHSSNRNAWFSAFADARIAGDTDNKYYNYYNFSATPQDGYAYAANNFYYEARFDTAMPDLNLECEDVKDELVDIMRFWLTEGDVDGFRLDAVRYFWYNNPERSADFVGWLKEQADGILRETEGEGAHAYFVGEDWATESEIATFYERGKGSTFFAFSVAQNAPSYIPSVINSAMHPVLPDPAYSAQLFMRSMERLEEIAGGGIAVPFLDNHDTTRIATSYGKNVEKIKFSYGLLSLYSGNIFTYYGDEIGAMGNKDMGDEYLRVGMLWKNTDTVLTPGSYVKNAASLYYSFGSVEQQLKDEDSILNYYKRCNNARNAFPALMRGTAVRVNEDGAVLVFTKTYKSQTVTVAVNFSMETETVEVSGTLARDICVSGAVTESGGTLTMPALSIAILQ